MTAIVDRLPETRRPHIVLPQILRGRFKDPARVRELNEEIAAVQGAPLAHTKLTKTTPDISTVPAIDLPISAELDAELAEFRAGTPHWDADSRQITDRWLADGLLSESANVRGEELIRRGIQSDPYTMDFQRYSDTQLDLKGQILHEIREQRTLGERVAYWVQPANWGLDTIRARRAARSLMHGDDPRQTIGTIDTLGGQIHSLNRQDYEFIDYPIPTEVGTIHLLNASLPELTISRLIDNVYVIDEAALGLPAEKVVTKGNITMLMDVAAPEPTVTTTEIDRGVVYTLHSSESPAKKVTTSGYMIHFSDSTAPEPEVHSFATDGGRFHLMDEGVHDLKLQTVITDDGFVYYPEGMAFTPIIQKIASGRVEKYVAHGLPEGSKLEVIRDKFGILHFIAGLTEKQSVQAFHTENSGLYFFVGSDPDRVVDVVRMDDGEVHFVTGLEEGQRADAFNAKNGKTHFVIGANDQDHIQAFATEDSEIRFLIDDHPQNQVKTVTTKDGPSFIVNRTSLETTVDAIESNGELHFFIGADPAQTTQLVATEHGFNYVLTGDPQNIFYLDDYKLLAPSGSIRARARDLVLSRMPTRNTKQTKRGQQKTTPIAINPRWAWATATTSVFAYSTGVIVTTMNKLGPMAAHLSESLGNFLQRI